MGSPADKGTFEKALESWRTTTQCAEFDYFPDGGIQNFWCHRPEGLTLEKLRSLAGVDVFVSGPHTATGLKLDAKASFGHYNPAFVQWLVDHASPPARGSVLRQMTQEHYNSTMRPLARVFWHTLRLIEADDACFQQEKSLYARQVAARTLPAQYYERWFFTMNPDFCPRAAKGLVRPNDTYFYEHGMDGGMDGNVVKTVYGFWIRRSLDGTMPTFAAGLRKLIDAYDPEMLTAARPVAPPPNAAPAPAATGRPKPRPDRNPFNVNVF